jgi:hypothetical protein
MKKIITLVCLSLSLSFVSLAQIPSIIPIPSQAVYPAGKFELPTSISISGPADAQLKVGYATLVGKLKRQRAVQLHLNHRELLPFKCS